MYLQKVISKKTLKTKTYFLLASCQPLTKKSWIRSRIRIRIRIRKSVVRIRVKWLRYTITRVPEVLSLRPNWLPPNFLSCKRVCPPPPWNQWGGQHSHGGEWTERASSDEWRKSLALSIRTKYVSGSLPKCHGLTTLPAGDGGGGGGVWVPKKTAAKMVVLLSLFGRWLAG